MKLHVWTRGDEDRSKLRYCEWTLYLSWGERGRTVAKGWWKLGDRRKLSQYAEVEFALGGEDNMAQVGGKLPFLGCCYVGVRVPRRLTRGWIYERREWALKVGYIGDWVRVQFAYDDSMRDMASYYRAMRARGEKSHTNRVQEWPGIEVKLDPKLRDRVLGRRKYEARTLSESRSVVPLPEGAYPCSVKLLREEWRRPRWPWNVKVCYSARVTPDTPLPVPGKGENSWDCDDDACWDLGSAERTVAGAIADAAKTVLTTRERYASLDWKPRDGWPVREAA